MGTLVMIINYELECLHATSIPPTPFNAPWQGMAVKHNEGKMGLEKVCNKLTSKADFGYFNAKKGVVEASTWV